MKLHRFFRQENFLIFKFSLLFIILLATATVKAQNPANFSGKWSYDKTKSKFTKGAYATFDNEILDITQNSATMTLVGTFIRQGSEDYKTTDSYKLDGKEVIVKDDQGTTKKSVKWSEDKKILTITTIMTVISNGISYDYLVADSYQLSENGLTLTIQSFSRNNAYGERTDILVYNKK